MNVKVPGVNVLLIGGGGREHALAWKLKQSPLLDRLYCAPGNAGIEEIAECVPLEVDDHAAVARFCKANDISACGDRTRVAAGGGACRRSRSGGHQSVRPVARGLGARRLQGLHQGPLRPPRDSNSALSSLHRTRSRSLLRHGSEPADRDQGRRACRRQRRDHRRDDRAGFAGDRRFLRRRLRRRRQGDRHRGIPRRRGSELLRAGRRRDRAPARHGAGSQARVRRATRARTPAAWAPIRRRRS